MDLTNPEFGTDPVSTSYVASVFEIYGEDVITDAFAATSRRAFGDTATTSDLQSREPVGEESKPPTANSEEST